MQNPKLISFELCPFVQRSVITLLEKDVPFEYVPVDLENPPSWFLELSPLGKVPALQIGDTVVFESAVINEYLDEITPGSLHPDDPLEKAVHRSWIEFASELIVTQYLLSLSADEDAFEKHTHELHRKLDRVEAILDKEGPYFSGKAFRLVDAAFAPAIYRLKIMNEKHDIGLFENRPKYARWSRELLRKQAVKSSIIEGFEEKFFTYLYSHSNYAKSVF